MKPCRARGCPAVARAGVVYLWEHVTDGWGWEALCRLHGAAAERRGAVAHRWNPGSHDEWLEGPVAVELRRGGVPFRLDGTPFVLTITTRQAYEVWTGAQEELWRQGLRDPGADDIASAAIEAAEALGL